MATEKQKSSTSSEKIDSAGGLVKDKKKVEVKDKGNKKKVEVEKEVSKKDFAFARGVSLRVSPKQCVYVCKIIKGKTPESAVARLQDVLDEKRAVPMAGLEVGHKKGKGLSGGKFPKNACNAVMGIVKQVSANAVFAGLENPVIVVAKSDRASAPFRRGGRKAKRTNIYIEVRDKEGKK